MESAIVAVGRAITTASGSPAAERLASSLFQCCETFANSRWQSVAWRFSGLTADGSPLEFTFSSAGNALRYTVDVAVPEVPNHQRIGAACKLAARLGHPRPDEDTLQRWSVMQQDHALRWGARLGVRETGNQESVKYYLEIPFEAQRTIQCWISPPQRSSIAVMMGYTPQSGTTEYYFRQHQLSQEQLPRLLGMLASDEERDAMVQGIEHVCAMPLASALRWICFGYSIAVGAGKTSIPSIALFVRTGAIGGAARARQRLLQWMHPSAKERSFYCQLVAGLPEAELPDHGVFSLSFLGNARVELSVNLSGVALARLLQSRPSVMADRVRAS
jgi:hypothetical protein